MLRRLSEALHSEERGGFDIDCIAVEDMIPRNMYERSALDWLIYNTPMEYVELILSGEIEDYLRKHTDYSRLG